MSTDSMMRETQRKINEATIDMDTEAYCWFMRELAEWCQTQADMQEYRDDVVYDENEKQPIK